MLEKVGLIPAQTSTYLVNLIQFKLRTTISVVSQSNKCNGATGHCNVRYYPFCSKRILLVVLSSNPVKGQNYWMILCDACLGNLSLVFFCFYISEYSLIIESCMQHLKSTYKSPRRLVGNRTYPDELILEFLRGKWNGRVEHAAVNQTRISEATGILPARFLSPFPFVSGILP